MATAARTKPLLVQKYGGSSVASTERLRNVARRVVKQHRAGWSVAVVVSAMGKTTDELIKLSREITQLPSPREMDMLLHAGEIIASALLAMAITEEGVPAVSFTGFQAGMLTDASHTNARIQEIQGKRVIEELERGRIPVITGFQGITSGQEITTLGRGGSDTSAIAFAVGLGAGRCEILTDVEGVYTTDPRIVPHARKLAWISYDELLELAVLGAKVMHSRSVEIARRFNVPFQVCTSFSDAPGTWVSAPEFARKELGIMEQVAIRGVAHNKNIAKVSIMRVPDKPGIAATLFSAIGEVGINILLIVQAQSHDGMNDITFIVGNDQLPRLRAILDPVVKKVGGERAIIDEKVATVSVVGEGVYREPGVAAKVFNSLASAGINIDLISTSNLMITCVIPAASLERGVQAVHDAFFPPGS
ncbi:MAG: aspartate kinase [Planctomycetes bacterium]|nr:aspartate kinase [Planctomycetota bacterium]